MAVHLRRGDFFEWCVDGEMKSSEVPCFYPMRQVGSCLAKRLKAHPHIETLFVATDGDDMEMELLRQILVHEVLV